MSLQIHSSILEPCPVHHIAHLGREYDDCRRQEDVLAPDTYLASLLALSILRKGSEPQRCCPHQFRCVRTASIACSVQYRKRSVGWAYASQNMAGRCEVLAYA